MGAPRVGHQTTRMTFSATSVGREDDNLFLRERTVHNLTLGRPKRRTSNVNCLTIQLLKGTRVEESLLVGWVLLDSR